MCSRSATSRFESVLSGGFFDSFEFGERGAQHGPGERMTDLSMKFSSSRTLPGQCHLTSACIVSAGMVSMPSAHALRMNCEEVADQNRNIVAALAQGWNRDGKNAQTVVEVASELSRVDHFREVAIRGGHEPDIYRNSASSADAFEFLLLQRPQNFGLKLQREVAYLIQEEGSLMGQLQPSDLLRDRPRKSSFFVAEQFAFE